MADESKFLVAFLDTWKILFSYKCGFTQVTQHAFGTGDIPLPP